MPPTYDSLVAKLIVSDADRPSALARAAQALTRVRGRGHRDDAAAVPRDGRRASRRSARVSTRPPTSKRRRGGYPRCPRDDRYPPAACGLAAPGAPRGLRPDLPARRAGRLGSGGARRALSGGHGHGGAGLHARGGRGRDARPERDRRRRGRGRRGLDGRSPGRGRARDPAARDLGAARRRAARRPSSSTRPSSSRSATRGPRPRRS